MSDIIEGTCEKPVALFSITDALLADIEKKYDVVPDATTKEGYAVVDTSLKALVKYRTSLESERKTKKQPHLDEGKKIDAEAKRIQKILDPMENAFKNAKAAEDKKAEIAKAKRIADIQKKIDAITVNLSQARGKDSAGIQEHIQTVGETDCLEGFYELTDDAIQARIDTLADLKIMQNHALSVEKLAADTALFNQQKAEFEASQPKPEPVNIDISAPIMQPVQPSQKVSLRHPSTDERHESSINSNIANELVHLGADKDLAKRIVWHMAKGEIENVTINY